MDSPLPTTAPTVNPHELMRLLTDLQVGIRKYSMYSGAHAIIPQVVASLTAQYHAVLGSHDALQIGVTKDEILYQGAPIATGNPVVRELARLLNQINVAGVTFRREATEADIHGFLQVLAECRGLASPEERDQSIERFCREVPSIAFQFISFQGAVKDRDAATDADSAGADQTEAPHLWRGLVNRLMTGELSDESRATLSSNDAEAVDAEQLAAAINLMGLQRKTGEQSYERTIVSYLHEKATSTASREQRAQMNQQLHRLFANLSPEVRQRLFRAALDPAGQESTAAEALADALPAPMLVEILEQLQVSNRNVSLPTLSLLKKFVTLAESDQTLAASLETKLGDQKDLLQELLTKRADRTFYPAQYRALLDEEFSEHALSPTAGSPAGAAEFDDGAVDHHLALIMLEMLEAPIRSTEQYSRTVASLRELIARGTGDHASSVFNEAITILGKRYASAADDQREFFRECVVTLFQADFAHHLLGPLEGGADHRQQRDVLAQLLEIVGPSIIPLLLDKLESEQNLKARKRLLALLRDCGDAVVPLATERLRHAQWYVVRNMLLLLRDLVAVQAVPEVTRCLQHQSAQVRLAAFQTLGTLAPRGHAFLQALRGALDDDDPKVFRAAVTHLVSSPDEASLQLASDRLLQDSSGRQRERQIALLRVIEQTGTSVMVPLLNAVTRHHLFRFWSWRKTRALRSAATRALAAIRGREETRTTLVPGPIQEQPRSVPAETDTETAPEVPQDAPAETAHVSPQDPV
ncbi:MAG: HEAT repeat domain-containing protein [Nitrospirota bacterium]